MERKEAIKRLEDIKYSVTSAKKAVETVETFEMMANDMQSDEEAIDMAIKALKDKKARYWKRRYLKLRDKIKYAVDTYESLNLNGSAEFLRIFILGENNEQRVDDGSIQCNVEE